MLEKNNLVAVYGSLRDGLHNHSVLGRSEYVLTGTISDATLYDYCGGGFPAVTLEGEQDVVVEIYRVLDDFTADNLDCLEGYPSFYSRKQVDVYQDNEQVCTAWVYFIEDDLSHLPVVENGDWLDYKLGKKS